MDLKLTGKIALVTGSTAGIGLQSAQSMEQKSLEHVRPLSLLKRFETVDEVAAMAIYVASELSSATNGAALRVDGGVVRAIL